MPRSLSRAVALLAAVGALAPSRLMPAETAAAAPEDIATLLEPIRRHGELPALAAVVLSGGRTVAEGATGVRRIGSDAAVTLGDRFHLGSDTKAMTATLLGMLVEEGKLSWDSTLGEVLGPVVPEMQPAWRDVTLQLLLTHRAGLPGNLVDDPELWSRLREARGTPAEQRLQLARLLLARPPVHPPGTVYGYANAGYALAAAMAERVTGRSWEELIVARVFRPLGIATAGFGAPGRPDALDEPLGHTAAGRPLPPGPLADNPPAFDPAGRVHMTLPDWARFIALHLRGDPANPHRECRLLQPATFARLHEPAPGPGVPYAMGWIVSRRPWARGDGAGDRGKVLTHAGSNTFWYCVAWLAPERDFAVLVACNRGGDAASRACDEAAGALIRRFAAER